MINFFISEFNNIALILLLFMLSIPRDYHAEPSFDKVELLIKQLQDGDLGGV